MARALLLFERQADASSLPTTVIRAHPKDMQGKCLPGSPNGDARLARRCKSRRLQLDLSDA
jgi:hypothetical protein